MSNNYLAKGLPHLLSAGFFEVLTQGQKSSKERVMNRRVEAGKVSYQPLPACRNVSSPFDQPVGYLKAGLGHVSMGSLAHGKSTPRPVLGLMRRMRDVVIQRQHPDHQRPAHRGNLLPHPIKDLQAFLRSGQCSGGPWEEDFSQRGTGAIGQCATRVRFNEPGQQNRYPRQAARIPCERLQSPQQGRMR